MKNKFFIDTNILVYTLDKFNRSKQKKARLLLKKLISQNSCVISTQVLEEFYVAATKKMNASPAVVKGIITSFEKIEIVHITPEIIKDAIDINILHKISFWDALIIAAADTAKCAAVITDDLNSKQTIKGIKIINPFAVRPIEIPNLS